MEEKKAQSRDRRHKIILAVLIAVALVSGFWFFSEYLENWKAQQEYERLAQIATETAATEEESTTVLEEETEEETQRETEPPYVSPINFEELAAINPDIVGWIRIPDRKSVV